LNHLLKQARKGFKASIDENRQSLSISVLADPTDPWGVATISTFTGRISHERRSVSNLEVGNAGFSTNLGRFLSVEYNVDFLKFGDIVTDANEKDWKLGAVDPLTKFGGIHGYQIPLEEAV